MPSLSSTHSFDSHLPCGVLTDAVHGLAQSRKQKITFTFPRSQSTLQKDTSLNLPEDATLSNTGDIDLQIGHQSVKKYTTTLALRKICVRKTICERGPNGCNKANYCVQLHQASNFDDGRDLITNQILHSLEDIAETS